jgi:hypothetical protein
MEHVVIDLVEYLDILEVFLFADTLLLVAEVGFDTLLLIVTALLHGDNGITNPVLDPYVLHILDLLGLFDELILHRLEHVGELIRLSQ